MKDILVNLVLVAVWVVLTAGLVRLIYAVNEATPIGGGAAIALWLLGQLVILSPVVWFIWRDRHVGTGPPTGTPE